MREAKVSVQSEDLGLMAGKFFFSLTLFCLCCSLISAPPTQQKAKEASETEAAEQPTKTSDFGLRRRHRHVGIQEGVGPPPCWPHPPASLPPLQFNTERRSRGKKKKMAPGSETISSGVHHLHPAPAKPRPLSLSEPSWPPPSSLTRLHFACFFRLLPFFPFILFLHAEHPHVCQAETYFRLWETKLDSSSAAASGFQLSHPTHPPTHSLSLLPLQYCLKSAESLEA